MRIQDIAAMLLKHSPDQDGADLLINLAPREVKILGIAASQTSGGDIAEFIRNILQIVKGVYGGKETPLLVRYFKKMRTLVTVRKTETRMIAGSCSKATITYEEHLRRQEIAKALIRQEVEDALTGLFAAGQK